LPAEDFPGDDDGMANEAAPKEYYIVVHTAYDDLYPVDTWSSEADYMRARDFLKALVGSPHGVSKGRYAGAELYEIPTRAQVDDYRKFKQGLRKASPEPDYSRVLLTQTKLHVHCLFNGISMSLPCGTVENYRLASALASELSGPAGRTVSEEGETFYLETREQLDALFALQRKLKVKRED
jgi:hypothetical protein